MSENEKALPPPDVRHIPDYYWVLVNYDYTPHVAIWDPKDGFTEDAAPSGVAVCQERVLTPAEVEALKAENARLRVALRTILNGPWPRTMDSPEEQTRFDAEIARAALGPTP